MQQNYHQPLHTDATFHLFSRAVGDEKLFRTDENNRYFLKKLNQHTNDVCKIYAYTLFPNHFHLLVKIEDENTIINCFEKIKYRKFSIQSDSISDFIMERFSNFLNGYTKAYNKMYARKGALFLDYLKRSKVNVDSDFAAFIFYIHKNAVHHGYTKSIGDWRFDSYRSILSESQSNLCRQEVIEFFGSKESFIEFHTQPISLKQNFIDF